MESPSEKTTLSAFLQDGCTLAGELGRAGQAAAATAAPRGLRHEAVGTEELGPTFNVFQMGCRPLQMPIHHRFKPGFIRMTLLKWLPHR